MKIEQPIKDVFYQLTEALQMLSDEQYSQRNKILFNASLGQHVRHIIELFVCLYNGYEPGVVNYEKRKRDVRIESDKNLAIELMQMITNNLDRPNKNLLLEPAYADHSSSATVATNYYREIIYNLEHTVHHMALIRIGINEVATITLPDGFGVASSTIKYRKECVQ